MSETPRQMAGPIHFVSMLVGSDRKPTIRPANPSQDLPIIHEDEFNIASQRPSRHFLFSKQHTTMRSAPTGPAFPKLRGDRQYG